MVWYMCVFLKAWRNWRDRSASPAAVSFATVPMDSEPKTQPLRLDASKFNLHPQPAVLLLLLPLMSPNISPVYPPGVASFYRTCSSVNRTSSTGSRTTSRCPPGDRRTRAGFFAFLVNYGVESGCLGGYVENMSCAGRSGANLHGLLRFFLWGVRETTGGGLCCINIHQGCKLVG